MEVKNAVDHIYKAPLCCQGCNRIHHTGYFFKWRSCYFGIHLFIVESTDDYFIHAWGCNAEKIYIFWSVLIRTDKQHYLTTSDMLTPDTLCCRRTDRFLRAFKRMMLLWDGLHINSYYLCHSTSGSAGVMKRNIPVAPACRHGTVISAAHTSDTDAHTSSLWMQHDRFL